MAGTNETPIPTRKRVLATYAKKYVFEFVLLFLAVFLGFFADNIREEHSEKQQALELAKSFYEELKSDSATAASRVEGRIKKEKAIDYLIAYLHDSSLNGTSKELCVNFLWATTVRTPVIFTPRTVVLEQLKTSGAIRYFKSTRLRQLVGDLSVAIDYLHERQELEAVVYQQYVEPIMVNHMDYEFQFVLFKDGIFDRLNAYETSNEYIQFHLSQVEKINRQGYINALSYYHINNIRSTRLIPLKAYTEVNAALLQELRKEFSL